MTDLVDLGVEERGMAEVQAAETARVAATTGGAEALPQGMAAASKGGDRMVIYIWKRKGWRKYKVREN